jgi:hypothetical protein
MPGTKAGAAKRWRCPTCGGLHRPDGPCVEAGPKTYTIDQLIEAGRVVEANGCHSFHGRRGRYPGAGGKGQRVRIVRHLLGLQPSDGMEARHTCDNDWCINREHLLPGTSQDNSDDMVQRGRAQRGEKHWNYKHGKRRRYDDEGNRIRP